MIKTVVGSGIPENKGLRMEESEKGLTLTTDTPTGGDRIITKNGRIFLIVSKELDEKVGEATIDLKRVNGELKLRIIQKGEKH